MCGIRLLKRSYLVFIPLSILLLGGVLTKFQVYAQDLRKFRQGPTIPDVSCETELNETMLPRAIRHTRREGNTFYFIQDARLSASANIEFNATCVNYTKSAILVGVCLERLTGDLQASRTLTHPTIPATGNCTIERIVYCTVRHSLARGIHRSSLRYWLVRKLPDESVPHDCGNKKAKLTFREPLEIVLEKRID